MAEPFVFDVHLDLSLNAVEWNRDLRLPLDEVRKVESHLHDKPGRGRGTVSLPEMRRGRVGLCVATQLARVEHDAWSPVFGWRSPQQAWAMTQAQLAWYREMEEAGEMVPIRDLGGLERHLALWEGKEGADAAQLPVGYVLSLEGADSLVTLGHLERSWEQGLRAIGPAHYGPGVYAQGTDSVGGFNGRGRDLLKLAESLRLILDVTHLSDQCFAEAMESYGGVMWASHHNARALVPNQRQLSDEQFLELTSRGGVVGVALDAWMMVPGWERGKTTPESAGLRLSVLVDHIDHYCQLAGNARHVGLGTDLDGCFGTEQVPQDLESIAGLQQLPGMLRSRGYADADIDGIMHGNFLRRLREALA
jgi:membrane dipeptidase